MEAEKSEHNIETYRMHQAALQPLGFPIRDCRKVSNEIPTPSEILRKLASPLQVQWTVSRKCNFHCPHCFNNSGPANNAYMAPPDPIIENICDASPMNVCLCGGEPFSWSNIRYITSRLRRGGIPTVSAVTNGYLASYDELQRIADEGLNSIQISIDGASAEEHCCYRPVPDSWRRAVQAAKDAVSIKGYDSVAVSLLPNRYNVDSFSEFVRMMRDIGVMYVRVQPLMPMGRCAEIYDDLRPTAEQYLKLQLLLMSLSAGCGQDGGNSLQIEWGDPLEHIWFLIQTDAVPQHLSIQTNGWYELSPYLPVLFGDACKHSIKEFWSKSVKEMWMIPLVLEMAEKLTVLEGMRNLIPRVYFQEPVLIDRFDEENWQFAQETADAQELIAYAQEKGLYRVGASYV